MEEDHLVTHINGQQKDVEDVKQKLDDVFVIDVIEEDIQVSVSNVHIDYSYGIQTTSNNL